MSYLEKLLEGVNSSAGSLQGFEWKTLDEIATITIGE